MTKKLSPYQPTLFEEKRGSAEQLFLEEQAEQNALLVSAIQNSVPMLNPDQMTVGFVPLDPKQEHLSLFINKEDLLKTERTKTPAGIDYVSTGIKAMFAAGVTMFEAHLYSEDAQDSRKLKNHRITQNGMNVDGRLVSNWAEDFQTQVKNTALLKPQR